MHTAKYLRFTLSLIDGGVWIPSTLSLKETLSCPDEDPNSFTISGGFVESIPPLLKYLQTPCSFSLRLTGTTHYTKMIKWEYIVSIFQSCS